MKVNLPKYLWEVLEYFSMKEGDEQKKADVFFDLLSKVRTNTATKDEKNDFKDVVKYFKENYTYKYYTTWLKDVIHGNI